MPMIIITHRGLETLLTVGLKSTKAMNGGDAHL